MNEKASIRIRGLALGALASLCLLTVGGSAQAQATSSQVAFRLVSVQLPTGTIGGIYIFNMFVDINNVAPPFPLFFECSPGPLSPFSACDDNELFVYPEEEGGPCPPPSAPPGGICGEQLTFPAESRWRVRRTVTTAAQRIPIDVVISLSGDFLPPPDEVTFSLEVDKTTGEVFVVPNSFSGVQTVQGVPQIDSSCLTSGHNWEFCWDVDVATTCTPGTTTPCMANTPGCGLVPGQSTCVAGVPGACVADVAGTRDGCNGMNDDCDDQTDEDCTPPEISLSAESPLECNALGGRDVTVTGLTTDAATGNPLVCTGSWTQDGTPVGQTETDSQFEVTAFQPLGTSTYTLTATDTEGDIASESIDVTVQDTQGPAVTAQNAFDTMCFQESPVRITCETITCTEDAEHSFTFPRPAADDVCQPGVETLTGEAISLCDPASATCVPFDVPEPFPNEQFTLVPGETLAVRWTATDGRPGTTTTVTDQIYNTRLVLPDECPMAAGQQRFEGTPGPDRFFLIVPAFVLGFGGNDIVVATSTEPDFLAGMDGDDLLVAGPGDTLLGGAGEDVLVSRLFGFADDAPAIRMFGELDDDVIDGSRGGSMQAYGIAGDDVIVGSASDDLIVPGPGVDRVAAGRGDDRVVLYDVCEIPSRSPRGRHRGDHDSRGRHERATKVLAGGKGHDTLVTPLPLAELRARGVVASGFENIVVDTSKRRFSQCFTG